MTSDASPSSMLVQLMDNADELFNRTAEYFPGVLEIFTKMLEYKAAGGMKTNDEWELKYSSIAVQMGLLNLGALQEEERLSPKTAAEAWFNALNTFYIGTGILTYGIEGLEAFNHSMLPAELLWMTALDANFGKKFTKKFMKAREDHADKINKQSKGFN